MLRKQLQLALSVTFVFKLASLNAVPNSFSILKLLGIWGKVGGVEGEESWFEKAKHLGEFFLNKGRNVSWGAPSLKNVCITPLWDHRIPLLCPKMLGVAPRSQLEVTHGTYRKP